MWRVFKFNIFSAKQKELMSLFTETWYSQFNFEIVCMIQKINVQKCAVYLKTYYAMFNIAKSYSQNQGD